MKMYRLYILICLVFVCTLSLGGCRQGGITERIIERNIKNNVYLEGKNVKGLKETELRKNLETHAARLNSEPGNAKFDDVTWDIKTAEKPGRRVNIEKTAEALLSAADGANLKLVVDEIKPNITADGLQRNIVEISKFSTPILDKHWARVNNIEIAAGRINYKKLWPGEEFSFNRTVGKRTEAKGYEEAPIIVKTEDGYKKGYGTGGGICQLASTLYNAANKAGMEITERHIHSKYVGYVPRGKDATVSYGTVDFKFKNNRKYPVMIRTYVGSNSLTIRIFENRNPF